MIYGHALRDFHLNEKRCLVTWPTAGPRHAVCACGALSWPTYNTAQRRRWYVAHLAEVRKGS